MQRSLSSENPRFFLVSAQMCRNSAFMWNLSELEGALFPQATGGVGESKRARRRTGVSMKYFGEVLLRLEARARGDIGQR